MELCNLIGLKIANRYLLQDIIGKGGQATVFQAEDAHTKGTVAIKVLLWEPLKQIISQHRFLQEARLLAGLRCSRIIPISDFGEEEITLDNTTYTIGYFVMPFLSRGSLEDRLKTQSTLSPQEAISITSQILEALVQVHQQPQPLVHRDIKPGNILFWDDGSIVLSDFGIAKGTPSGSGTTWLKTSTGEFMGTPPYAAPEVSRGQGATPSSDLYSVGVVFYRMLAGEAPDVTSERTFLPVRTKDPSIPPTIDGIISRLLEPDPHGRYQSARDVMADLNASISAQAESIQTGPVDPGDGHGREEPPAPFPQPWWKKRSGKQRTIGLIAVGLVIMIIGGYLLEYFTVWPPLAFLVPASYTIEIDYDLPLSGNAAVDGQAVENGIFYARDHDASMVPQGYTVQFNPLDDTGGPNGTADPDVGVKKVQQAIADAQVAAIIGPLDSGVALKEIPVTNEAPIALISPSNTYPCLTENSGCPSDPEPMGKRTYFRLPASDTIQGKKEADYLTNLGYRSVYLIEDQADVYSDGFATVFENEWKNNGGAVLPTSLSSTSTVAVYQHQLSLLTPPYPDLIFYSGTTPGATNLREAMLSIPVLKNIPFAGNDGIVAPSFTQNAARISGGGPVYATVPLLDPSKTPVGQQMQSDLISQGKPNFRAYTASAYDCVNIVLQAISQVIANGTLPPKNRWDRVEAGKFRQATIQAIQSISYNNGATGGYTFKVNGDSANTTVSVYQLDTSGQTQWKLIDTL